MATPHLIPTTMERLAFIRLLHQKGVDETQLPTPLNFTSILTLHDSVELFLILAGEHLGVTLPNHIQFMKYWDELHPKKHPNGVDLSVKVGMDRLNRHRNTFKHTGVPPGIQAIELARSDVAVFFEDNAPKVFGVSFAAIDMSDLIPQEHVRDLAKQAATQEEEGNRTESMALLREAFDVLLEQHVGRHESSSSPFSLGPDLPHSLTGRTIQAALVNDRMGSARSVIEHITKLTEIVSATQRALRVMTLGIDYHAYVRFDRLTPHVSYSINLVRRWVNHHPDYAPESEHYAFALQFVVTAALKAAETDAAAAPPPWLPERERRQPWRTYYRGEADGEAVDD